MFMEAKWSQVALKDQWGFCRKPGSRNLSVQPPTRTSLSPKIKGVAPSFYERQAVESSQRCEKVYNCQGALKRKQCRGSDRCAR
jgi:hypothetical protein